MSGQITIGFDGECLMCSRGMRFLAERDRHHRLSFIPLQSPRGQAMAARAGETGMGTMVVEADGEVLVRSDAALECLQALGGRWAMLARAGRFFPARDTIYRLIAARRHRFFRKSACALPSPALLERMASGDGV